MHATKGGWVGQTFALAKCSDSGGKKSRIRRSKEERKAMVESFIKKYQNSNNGNFPSLNLTHKEVGGSFYTVREIVREIIQENRVLGPAKLTPVEEIADSFLEQYPLGSISIEPQIQVFPSNETHIITHILPNHHPHTSEEQVLDPSGQYPEPQHQTLEDGKFVNWCTKAGERNEDSEIHTELRVGLEGEEDVEKELQASKAKTTQVTTDVVVEAFPVRPISERTYGLDGKSSETRDLTGTLEENEMENMGLEVGNSNSVLGKMDFLENSSGLVDEKAGTNLAGPFSERNCVLVDEKADPSLERLNNSTTIKESIALDANDGTEVEVEDSLPAGNKPMNSPNGFPAENLNSTNTSSSHGHSVSKEAITFKDKSDIQHGGSSQKGSNPSLDRINLGSWEATSEKSAEPETNPLLAFFKAFAAAFVKFWSE